MHTIAYRHTHEGDDLNDTAIHQARLDRIYDQEFHGVHKALLIHDLRRTKRGTRVIDTLAERSRQPPSGPELLP